MATLASSQKLKDPPAGAAEATGIRTMTKEFGVSARTLRFYEEKGLLNPRREGQDRLYSRRDRARLKYVQMGKCVGFSLEEIREMLDLYEAGDRDVSRLRRAHQKFGERIARLERQRVDLDRAIAELAHTRKLIEGMLTARERGGGASAPPQSHKESRNADL